MGQPHNAYRWDCRYNPHGIAFLQTSNHKHKLAGATYKSTTSYIYIQRNKTKKNHILEILIHIDCSILYRSVFSKLCRWN